MKHNEMRNLNRAVFNCGGYALNVFTWYLPFNKNNGYYDFDHMERHVAFMLKDFGGRLRLIENESDALPHERVVFFRGCSYDFHYVYKGKNGHYYHKMGSKKYIEHMKKKEVYGPKWCCRYNGKIYIFALDMRS